LLMEISKPHDRADEDEILAGYRVSKSMIQELSIQHM
jgi:hypothetical protein